MRRAYAECRERFGFDGHAVPAGRPVLLWILEVARVIFCVGSIYHLGNVPVDTGREYVVRTEPNHVDDNLGAGEQRKRRCIIRKYTRTNVPLGTGIVLSPSSPRGLGI